MMDDVYGISNDYDCRAAKIYNIYSLSGSLLPGTKTKNAAPAK